MDRRAILAGAAALPVWLSVGFGAQPKAATSTKHMRAALDRAREIGKPLLVLIVSDQESDAMQRGHAWGHYLAHLGEEAALDLALCAVTCARAADLTGVMRKDELVGVDSSTWAVLLETDSSPARAVLARGDVPVTMVSRHEGPGPEMRAVLERILRAAIVPDEHARKRRLEQCNTIELLRKMLGEKPADSDAASFESLGAGGPVRRCDLDRWAAFVRFGKAHPVGQVGGQDQLRLLADAVRIRLFENDPDGATWMARMAYCPPCGMGHVPPSARLFLKFYAT